MLETRRGMVVAREVLDANTLRLDVDVQDARHNVISYRPLVGEVNVGDEVLINTTACTMGLGTGGMDFVVTNLTHPTGVASPGPGHIIKLRYTPHQFAVHTEEEANQQEYVELPSLNGMPVVAAGLHSQIALVSAGIKAKYPDARIAYIMTDGAALPIGVSNLVRTLLKAELIQETITCGQAFGGMREAVNLYSALTIARKTSKADVAIVCQGPGNVGTNTALGYSGIEVGQIINAAHSLQGRPVAVVRMSQADQRRRHRLISHHTITALSCVALKAAMVVLPFMDDESSAEAVRQLEELKLFEYHEIRSYDGVPGVKLLRQYEMNVSSMGRIYEDDPLFFLSASAAGRAAAEMLDEGFAG